MAKPFKMLDIDGDNAQDLGEAMVALSAVTRRVAHCSTIGAILLDEGGHMTLCIHPRIQHAPEDMKEFLRCLRQACDLYEQQFVKNKVQ